MVLKGRVRIRCVKRVRKDLWVRDSFSVVVFKNEEASAKAKYESMGYLCGSKPL